MADGPACLRHPDRPGTWFCAKYAEYFCEECAACRDPKIYCSYRGSCMINELDRQARRSKRGVTSHHD